MEPNLDWSSEFVRIVINYFEDKCNSIELKAVELLGGVCVRVDECVCVCVRVCGLVCLCVVGVHM